MISRACGNSDHECEGGIEKSVPSITIWHHEACRVMTNGDYEGQIFYSTLTRFNELFFLLTIKYHIFMFKNGSQKFLNLRRCDVII